MLRLHDCTEHCIIKKIFDQPLLRIPSRVKRNMITINSVGQSRARVLVATTRWTKSPRFLDTRLNLKVLRSVAVLGLSTSCSGFPKTFPVIPQKVAQKMSKVAFCNESCSKLLRKTKTFCCCCSLPLFGLMQKCANCTTKVRSLSIFVQFCVQTSVAK